MITEDLFVRKSKIWRDEMQEIESELESLRKATESYHEEGLRLLELAQVAHGHYLAANPVKQAKILKCVASNLVLDGATVSPTYRKPFDILAERPTNENWLPAQDVTRTHPLTHLTQGQARRVNELERLVA